MLNKDKLLELAKKRGVVLAEETLNQLAEGGAHLILDILEEAAKQTKNTYDDIAVAAVMGPARKMADEVEIKL